MSETSKLESQLSQLTEQIAQLNTTTREQFRQSKLGSNYNPFSSAYSSSISSSMSLSQEELILDRIKGRYNPFTHNRLDPNSVQSSKSLYISPQDRIRFDSKQASDIGRLGMGLSESGAGIVGVKIGSGIGATAGAALSGKIGGLLGASLSTLLPGIGMLAGGAVGAPIGASAFKMFAGQNQRITSNAINRYMMENSFRFMNPNQSIGQGNLMGAGFGMKESRTLSRDIAMMTDDTNLSSKTLMDLTKSFSEGDLMKGVNNSKEFSKKFKGLVETAKTMAYMLNDSVEDAGKFMTELQLKGFDMSKLTNQTAKMKNLSNFLGKNVSEVVATSVGYASGAVSGTNANFTTALGNQTYATQVMNDILDNFNKRGDRTFKTAYDTIKNMDGPESAANVYSKMMQAFLSEDKSLQSQIMAASADFDPTTKSFSFNPAKFKKFQSMNLSLADADIYSQSQMRNEYLSKMSAAFPGEKFTPEMAYMEFSSSKQNLIGNMSIQDQSNVLKTAIESIRKQEPSVFGNSSNRVILSKVFGFDSTSADIADAVMRQSSDSYSSKYENYGITADYIAKRRANDNGMVGAIKKFGAKVGNDFAGIGIGLTSPVIDVLDKMARGSSNFLFGQKDFNYQEEFGLSESTLKKYFTDASGKADINKLGRDFYEEFSKGLKDSVKNGSTISQVFIKEYDKIKDIIQGKQGVGVVSSGELMIGSDSYISRWTSSDGLGSYAKSNYDMIQSIAAKNGLSDQTLGFVGQVGNMNKGQLEAAATRISQYVKDYGGNESLAIAAYEKGKAAVDASIKDTTGIDINELRANGDFSTLNLNSSASELSRGYMSGRMKQVGMTESQFQGIGKSIQTRNTASKDAMSSMGKAGQLMGAIELAMSGDSGAMGADFLLDARLEAIGIKPTNSMSKAEKEALLHNTQGAFSKDLANFEAYILQGKGTWRKNALGEYSGGNAGAFEKLSADEKSKTVDTWLSMVAGKEKLSSYEEQLFAIVRSNYSNISEGKPITSSDNNLRTPITSKGTINNLGIEDIQSLNIKQLRKNAEAEDTKNISTVVKAQEDAKKLIRNMSFSGKKGVDSAIAKQEITSALYSGDTKRINDVISKYGLSDKEAQELTRLGTLKVGDTNALSLDSSKMNDNSDAAGALEKKTKFDYAASKSLLSDLKLSEDFISSLAIADNDLEGMSFEAIAVSQKRLREVASNRISALSSSQLNELLATDRFTQGELQILTKPDGSGNSALILNKDGSYSLNPNADKKSTGKAILDAALEQYDGGLSETGDIKKETNAKGNLTSTTENLLSTMETTTEVMIEGAKKLVKRQDELAKIVGVEPKRGQSSSPSTSVPYKGGTANGI